MKRMFAFAALISAVLSATPSPILNIPMNEGEGTVVKELVTGKEIKITNPEKTAWAEGPDGAVLQFKSLAHDKPRAMVMPAWPEKFDLEKPFTLMIDFKAPANLVEKVEVYEIAIFGTNGEVLNLHYSWRMFYVAYKEKGEKKALVTQTSKQKILPDTWYKLAVVLTGSKLQIYVNGSLQAEQDGTFDVPDGKPYLVLGTNGSTGVGYGLEGILANFKLFGVALSADEIAGEIDN